MLLQRQAYLPHVHMPHVLYTELFCYCLHTKVGAWVHFCLPAPPRTTLSLSLCASVWAKIKPLKLAAALLNSLHYLCGAHHAIQNSSAVYNAHSGAHPSLYLRETALFLFSRSMKINEQSLFLVAIFHDGDSFYYKFAAHRFSREANSVLSQSLRARAEMH